MPGDFLEQRSIERRVLTENNVCPDCGADNLQDVSMKIQYPIQCISCGHVILPSQNPCDGDSCIGETIYIKCKKCYETEPKETNGSQDR